MILSFPWKVVIKISWVPGANCPIAELGARTLPFTALISKVLRSFISQNLERHPLLGIMAEHLQILHITPKKMCQNGTSDFVLLNLAPSGPSN
jgi:hypothetical protein